METVLRRRPLEVCVFYYLDAGCAVAMCMSKAPRPTPITANSCCPGPSVSRLPAYCQALQFAPTAPAFVAALRERLREVAQQVDAAYPANTA